MTISFAFSIALFVMLVMSVSQTQKAQRATAVSQAEARRMDAVHEFIGQMLGAAHAGPLDQDYRAALTQRLDAHAPRVRQVFPGDVDAQLRLLGIAASVHLALGDVARHVGLRLQQAELLLEAPARIQPEFIASLLSELERELSNASGVHVIALIDRTDQLLKRAHLDASALRARWFLAKAQMATQQGDKTAAFSAWQGAESTYASMGRVDQQRFVVLKELGLAALAWQPEAAQEYLERALEIASVLQAKPTAALAEQVYPSLAGILAQKGQTERAIQLLESGAALPLTPRLEVQYALSLHALGRPRDWRAIAAVAGDPVLADRGFELVEAMFASGHTELARETLARVQAVLDALPESASKLHASLLEMRGLRLQSNLWLASRAGAALEARLNDDGLPSALRAKARLELAALARDKGAQTRAHSWLQEVVMAANGNVTEAALHARIGLADIAYDRQDATEMLRQTTASLLAYPMISADHDRRLGPAVWTQHARALALSGDSASAQIWFQRARIGLQSLLPEPAAREALARLDEDLAVLRVEAFAFEP